MIDQLDILEVNEVFHDSIKRPFLFVYPDTKLLELTTFLAIGPEIYVDGLVVVVEINHDGKRMQTPIGRIGGRNVLSGILDCSFSRHEDTFLQVTASQIMVEMTEGDCVELKSPLSQVIDIFKRTRFAFVPIISTARADNNRPIIVGTISVRDFLPLLVNKTIGINLEENEKFSINQISSSLISVNKNTTIRNAIRIMINKGIRNIVINTRNLDCIHNNKEKGKDKAQGSKLLCIVNDRKIMEFLLSHKRRNMTNPIFGTVSDLDMIQIRETKNDITLRGAAQYLMDVKNPFLVLEGKDSIITPWDLVMRTIGNAN
jgi:CBS domain-containing protein